MDDSSIGVVAEQWLERAAPFALPFGEQLVGWREPAGDGAVERCEVDGLVIALRIELLARAQASMGDLDHVARQIRQRQALELGRKARPRGMTAQIVVVLDGPILDQVPGRIERALLVEQPDP